MSTCRLWEIAENLHRAELTALERDKLIAEWCRIVGREIPILSRKVAMEQIRQFEGKPISVQPEQKIGRGRPNSGEADAARQLGLPRLDVRRACKVASLTPEAQAKAVELGLDNNRTALLEAATLCRIAA